MEASKTHTTTIPKLFAGICVLNLVFFVLSAAAIALSLDDLRSAQSVVLSLLQTQWLFTVGWLGAASVLALLVWPLLARKGWASDGKVFFFSALTAATLVSGYALAVGVYAVFVAGLVDNELGAVAAMFLIVGPITGLLFGLASWAGWRIAYRRVATRPE